MPRLPHPLLHSSEIQQNFEALEDEMKKGEEALEKAIEALQATIAPGPWEELETVNAKLKVVAGWETPKVRTEGNETRAFLKGIYEATAEIVAGTVLFTLPVACRSKVKVAPVVAFNTATAGATRLPMNAAGEVTAAVTLTAGQFIYFDGTSWNLT